MRRNLLAVLLLAGILGSAAVTATAATPVATTEHFAFHSDPRINLHHLLYQWAVAEEAEALETEGGEERRLVPVPVAEREQIDRLSQGERAVWSEAVRVYRRHAAGRDLLFDRGLMAFRDALDGPVDGDAPPPAELLPLRRALDAAEPVYRRLWWPAHDAANRRWIADLLPALVLHADAMVAGLEAAYGASWPPSPVHVDVSAHSHFLGAYTGPGPRSTISSTRPDYRMPGAFEMVFHEASHSRLIRPVQRLLGDIYGEERPPRDLWHAVLFHTVGHAARRVLEDAGVVDDYETYAEQGLWRRGRWADFHAALEAHWRPFLEGAVDDRRAALERVAAALGPGAAGANGP